MAYDEAVAARIRAALPKVALQPGEELDTVRMFGGLCFTLNKKMLVGVESARLVVRLSDAEFEEACVQGRAAPMDFTGRPMRNFAYVSAESLTTEEDLVGWISRSAAYVRANVLSPPARTKKGRS